MKSLFLWPKETFIPNSLYKRYVFIGEVASSIQKFSEVEVLDLSVTNISKRALSMAVQDCDYIFIPVEVTTVRDTFNVSSYIRNYTKGKIVVYGTAPLYNPKFFSQYFDIVIASGFWTEIIPALIQNKTKKIIKDGNIYKLKTPSSDSQWYYPCFEKLPMDEYLKISKHEVDLCVQIGCPFNCSFCSEKILHPHPTFYQRPVENIINFINTVNFQNIFFDATTFTVDKKWVHQLCDRLIKNTKKVSWRTVTRVDQLDNDLCKKMKAAGCKQIGLGIETLSLTTQKKINKEIHDNILNALTLLKQNDIEPRLFFILGLPGQTKDDIEAAIEFTKINKCPSRWKEYIPLSETSKFTSLDQYDPYRTDHFFFHKVKGLSNEMYMKVLLKNERF